ncbi:MAG TPA: methyltransferase domain-containing protein [Nitrospirae bacterium]|nr:antilisterial bacteriocin subtilosin biosynthesis protein AlbA [bacterium BMS3Abin06]HDH12960.1 methyltransferase domain-containing protein [Nitrospirota bacterium]HDZ00448.1 methyltransferase domain-containing protein [Nitrospirota bacterium]
MAKACCDTGREERIKQYQLDQWSVANPDLKAFNPDAVLYSPEYIRKRKNGITLFIDPESPNWLSVNNTAAEILKLCNGKHTLSDIQDAVCKKYGVSDKEKVKQEISDFLSAVGLLEFVSDTQFERPEYAGRSKAIAPHKLDELWIYYTLACNLRCKHCLVSAGQQLKKELTLEEFKGVVDEAIKLGVKRFYITGGEPFIKEGIFELIRYITKTRKRELIVLTNATLFDDEKIAALKKLAGPRLLLQASLEGSNADIHDKLRGKGTFDKTVEGIKKLKSIGITPIVSTAINKYNEKEIPKISRFLSKLGVEEHNVLWMHAKGRGASNMSELFVPSENIARTMRQLKKTYKEQEIILDNVESLKVRVRTKRGRKNDLCNNCYEKICVNADGHVYPCASLNGDSRFDAGSVRKKSLEDIWLDSKVMIKGRNNSVQDKPECRDCYLEYFCGGGCTSHSYYASEVDTGKGSITARDPYCSTYKSLFEDIIWELASEGVTPQNGKGYISPLVYNAMDAKLPGHLGKGIKSIDKNFEVGCYHCSCVLSVDVEDDEEVCKPEIKGHVTKTVKKKFSKAAFNPVAEYYCPTGYKPEDLAHIPNEVLDVSYGCGNPAALAAIKKGETIVDLGAGGGIDCFIAAKKLGKKGRVIGIDMTDEMVEKAAVSAEKVAEALGYSNVEFRSGDISELPVDDNSVDLVISNCVINLTEDKSKVLDEIYRILKPGGRFLISDIVSDKPVPGYLKRDKELWSACLSGALTDRRFRDIAENAGFPDVRLTRNYLYKKVEYIEFFSITMQGSKPREVSCGSCACG